MDSSTLKSKEIHADRKALLVEALKSRPDVSGRRTCFGCGKTFDDVLRLASHIKDRHNGLNEASDNRPSFTFADVLNSTVLEKPSSKVTREPGQPTRRLERPHSQAPPVLTPPPGVRERRKKRLTRVKKGYLRSKAKQAETYWLAFLAEVDDALHVSFETSDNNGDGKKHDSLLWMKEIAEHVLQKAQSQLYNCESSRSVEGRCTPQLLSASVKPVQEEEEVSYQQREMPEERTADDYIGEADSTESRQEIDDSIILDYASDDGAMSDDSSSSDGSFGLQWGDALKSWAHAVKTDIEQEEKTSDLPIVERKDSFELVPERRLPVLGEAPVCPQRKVHEDMLSKLSCTLCNIIFSGEKSLAEHLTGKKHRSKVCQQEGQSGVPILHPPLRVPPSSNADAAKYAQNEITPELNTAVLELLKKLLEWQERVRRTDPANAKRKRRMVCGLREATKLTRLGKVKAIIVAPNINTLINTRGEEENPVEPLLAAAKDKNVSVIFALSRQKMGRLLGRHKSASVFALVDVSGAEELLRSVAELSNK